MAHWDCPTNYKITERYHGTKFDYKDKGNIVDYHYRLTLNKTQSMFEWKNLPKTISQRDMELLIQTNGYGIFLKCNDNFFCLYGSLGGLFNQNYQPTRAVLANHYLTDVNGSYKIFYDDVEFDHAPDNLDSKGDCVVIYNDPMYMGMEPIINTYANRLADTYISRRVVTILSRYINVFTAQDNNAYQNILDFLAKVENGELSAILDGEKIPTFDEGNIKSLPMAANSGSARMLTELIECEQYDKASLYNELGLQANYNMKREAINSNESQLNQDALFPFVDIMLESRKLACERINKCFGLDISVDFSSVWKLVHEQVIASLDAQKAESEEPNQLGKNNKKEEQDVDGSIVDSDDDVGGNKSGDTE